jgi:hypothetical protein
MGKRTDNDDDDDDDDDDLTPAYSLKPRRHKEGKIDTDKLNKSTSICDAGQRQTPRWNPQLNPGTSAWKSPRSMCPALGSKWPKGHLFPISALGSVLIDAIANMSRCIVSGIRQKSPIFNYPKCPLEDDVCFSLVHFLPDIQSCWSVSEKWEAAQQQQRRRIEQQLSSAKVP